MKLLTKDIIKKLPEIGSTDGLKSDEKKVICKFFTPWSNWTWYAIEFDGKDEFYGYIDGTHPEYGYFYLSDLSSMVGAFGLKIERDLYFKPCTMDDILYYK